MSTLFVLERQGKTYERSVDNCGKPQIGDVVVTPFGRTRVQYVGLDLASSCAPFYYATLEVTRPISPDPADWFLAATGWENHGGN